MTVFNRIICFVAFGLVGTSVSLAQEASEYIRLNQIGFYPNGEKVAIIADTAGSKFFYILEAGKKDTVFKGALTKPSFWEYSEEYVRQADFSSLKTKGEYVLYVPKVGYSYTFSIKDKVFSDVAKASLKAYYYQRASIDLPEQYAGKWARKSGHPDNEVIVHNSAASSNRKTGDVIKSTKGWYDAGDYNKYTVNSGISMYTLMSIYEDFPFYADTLRLNIPESTNRIPDLLDEILWNLRWMLTMQDPGDGGVYHKLTNSNFDGSVMPENATKPRYVVKKTTNATLDFAAVMAQAYRVFGNYRKQLPGLADSCLKASEKAFLWAKRNANAPYIQSELSDPSIMTGAYDDFNFSDEFQWAALELLVSTGKYDYYEESNIDMTLNAPTTLPDWKNVGTLGLFTFAKNLSKFEDNPKFEDVKFEAITKKLVKLAKTLKNHKENESAYKVSMGTEYGNFGWGSNSFATNQGFLLLQAFLVTGDRSYLESANANLDYILGRNATTFSFLTGYGEKSAMNPHHRPSEADGIDAPVPGFMVGGPNPGQEDKGNCAGKAYPSSLPAKSYIDHKCSYASNEIAINWNAPFAYLSNGLEAIRSGNYTSYAK
jgi:endoglucanase